LLKDEDPDAESGVDDSDTVDQLLLDDADDADDDNDRSKK
jgi:hypothetical protein